MASVRGTDGGLVADEICEREDSIGRLVTEVEPVALHAPADHVYDRFTLDRRLHAIPVVDGVEPVGLVARYRFCGEHAARYGRGGPSAPIANFMERAPLVVDESWSVDELASAVLEDGGRSLSDGFIVTRDGCYRGVGTGLGLLRALAERAHGQSHTGSHLDAVTGLPGPRLFDDRLATALAAAERARGRLAVLLLELDRDDAAPGDGREDAAANALLIEAAGRLQLEVRKSDTVARLGGETFGILLPSVPHAEAARHVARKLHESLVPPCDAGGAGVSLSISIGVAVFPDDASSARRLMQCAERAVRQAKLMRGSVALNGESATFDEAPNVCTYGSLRSAIEQRRLSLAYQPQLDLTTGRICGVEALLRWPDRVGVSVPANEIIAVAETSGLIVPLAEWVLATACQQMRAWHEAGVLVVRLAVNVSGVQLRQHALPAIVERTLRETGVPPPALEIELSERVLLDASPAVTDALRALAAARVRISMDDFGTGALPIAQLARLPVDSIKLDRAFVAQVGTDERATAASAAAIAMAHALRLAVIAEGVETAEQLRALRAQRCDVMQGYYFSRPVPADFISTMVRAGGGMEVL
jgi:diguanylate cyclase (GGDEF)-like protein